MIDYSGQVCLVCKEAFSAEDDIVVCPECGTPYHRHCYREQGKCINTPLHESGGSWQIEKHKEQEAEKKAAHQEEMRRQAAEREQNGMHDPSNAPMYDGIRMNNDPCLGLDPEEKLEDTTIKEMTSFIATNRFYYLPMFRIMKLTGKKMSFNLTALFFPQLYFANRKMWAMTLLSIVLQFAISLPSTLVMVTEQMGISIDWINMESTIFAWLLNLTAFADLIFSMVCCLFANYFYFRFALRKIRSIKQETAKETADPAQLYANLEEAGGTSTSNMVLALIIQMALVFTFSLAILLL